MEVVVVTATGFGHKCWHVDMLSSVMFPEFLLQKVQTAYLNALGGAAGSWLARTFIFNKHENEKVFPSARSSALCLSPPCCFFLGKQFVWQLTSLWLKLKKKIILIRKLSSLSITNCSFLKHIYCLVFHWFGSRRFPDRCLKICGNYEQSAWLHTGMWRKSVFLPLLLTFSFRSYVWSR